jgi:hypothetical protein
MFFDILGLGGSGLKVFQAGPNDKIYKITFDFREQSFKIYFVQEDLTKGIRPSFLADIGLLTVVIKAGDSGHSDPYSALDSIAGSIPAGSLVISDQELGAAALKPVQLTLDEGYRLYGGSFSLSGGSRHLPSYRPDPTPFGYSVSNAFIYRVDQKGEDQ